MSEESILCNWRVSVAGPECSKFFKDTIFYSNITSSCVLFISVFHIFYRIYLLKKLWNSQSTHCALSVFDHQLLGGMVYMVGKILDGFLVYYGVLENYKILAEVLFEWPWSVGLYVFLLHFLSIVSMIFCLRKSLHPPQEPKTICGKLEATFLCHPKIHIALFQIFCFFSQIFLAILSGYFQTTFYLDGVKIITLMRYSLWSIFIFFAALGGVWSTRIFISCIVHHEKSLSDACHPRTNTSCKPPLPQPPSFSSTISSPSLPQHDIHDVTPINVCNPSATSPYTQELNRVASEQAVQTSLSRFTFKVSLWKGIRKDAKYLLTRTLYVCITFCLIVAILIPANMVAATFLYWKSPAAQITADHYLCVIFSFIGSTSFALFQLLTFVVPTRRKTWST